MDEKDLAPADTQLAQLSGEGVAGDKWAGGRWCRHGSAVSPTGAPNATGLIDQRSFSQVRLGVPK
ncbi:hypothetical protein TUSST3_50010 [Streptomyces sp. TUS-ST3]|nr:hypothetical protein TUSST3_50010 [Streptomyces sp. TUS-ST3]